VPPDYIRSVNLSCPELGRNDLYDRTLKEMDMTRQHGSRLYFHALLLGVLLAIPTVAFPAERASQKPCADEIEKYCNDVRPGEGRIVQCLQDHDSELSTVCREKIKVVLQKVEEAKQACAKDISKFCAGVTPGGGRLLKCLKPHVNELAPECREKFVPIRAQYEGTRKPGQ